MLKISTMPVVATDGDTGEESSGQLTPREAQCLRLLARGLDSAMVASRLDIRPATLNRHLLTARRKLGVHTTMQAVVKFIQPPTDPPAERSLEVSALEGNVSDGQTWLIDRIGACHSFEQAWQALHEYLEKFGVLGVTFGVIADPSGELDDAHCRLWSSFPLDLGEFYDQAGGIKADIVARHVGASTQAREFDVNLGRSMMKDMGMFEVMLDNGIERTVCLPARDPLTGAPFGFNLALSSRSAVEIKAHYGELMRTMEMFWSAVQAKRLLAQSLGLTVVEREALGLAAGGCSVAEIALRQRVSRRAAEKTLSRIRCKVGARTTAEAVYRAMVYRALGD